MRYTENERIEIIKFIEENFGKLKKYIKLAMMIII